MVVRFGALAFGLIMGGMLTFSASEVQGAASAKDKSAVLATVGKEQITYNQLEHAYSKNVMKGSTPFRDIPRDTLRAFLDMYINYRLKVQEALARGLHQDSAVIADLKQNRKLLAEPFYFDRVLTEAQVATMTARRFQEIEIAVILLPPSPSDTVAGMKRAENLLAQLLKNKDEFGKFAADSSIDESTRSNGGKLNFATSGILIRELEEAAYNLKPGQIHPKPISTRFGYFIIKLERILPRSYVKHSHILFVPQSADDDTLSGVKSARTKADSVYKLLTSKKITFDSAARTFSDDDFSAKDGGSLGGWYSRATGFDKDGGRLVPEFEEALFTLKQGEISKPIRTNFGFHIIKADSVRRPDTLIEAEEMRKLYKRLYLEQDKAAHLVKKREELGFRWKENVLSQFLASLDTTKTNLDTTWSNSLPKTLLNDTLYVMPRQPLRVGELATALNERSDMRGFPLTRDGISKAVNRLAEPLLLEILTEDMEKKYEEFGRLMEEFRDGTLIFKVEDEEVWSKQKFDTLLAKEYYEKNKANYLTDKELNLVEAYVYTDTAARRIAAAVRGGADLGDFAEQETMRRGFREKRGERGFLSVKREEIARIANDSAATVGSVVGPFQTDNGFAVVQVKEIKEPRQKTFEEAIPDFATIIQEQVQQQLTENWLKQLREKFPVRIEEKKISSMWKK